MELYSENDNYKLYQGNMLNMLDVIEKESVDSIVTDPPYGLTSITKRFGKENSAECQYGKDGSFARLSRGFMGKEWDGSGIEYNIDTWRKCYEVLKPGGYLLAFGGSRTFHRIAVAIEDAGFEIRDTIMWLYGAGFPKSMDISKSIDKKEGVQGEKIGERTFGKTSTGQSSGWHDNHIAQTGKQDVFAPATDLAKQWQGWGTALKPSFEPIIVARKPFKGSLVDNVIEYGVGGINIDECRVESNEDIKVHNYTQNSGIYGKYSTNLEQHSTNQGRFPANTILTYDETDFDEVCGGFPNTKSVKSARGGATNKGELCYSSFNDIEKYECGYNDSGSASRYFYCAKASKKDRDEGLDMFEEKYIPLNNQATAELKRGNVDFEGKSAFCKIQLKKNTHPTVKPTNLMQYLVRLVSPDGATILDPFNGSGSTGKAVMYENKERNKNYKYIGIELTEEYLPIAKARIEYVCNLEEKKDNQTDIFEFIGSDK